MQKKTNFAKKKLDFATTKRYNLKNKLQKN